MLVVLVRRPVKTTYALVTCALFNDPSNSNTAASSANVASIPPIPNGSDADASMPVAAATNRSTERSPPGGKTIMIRSDREGSVGTGGVKNEYQVGKDT